MSRVGVGAVVASVVDEHERRARLRAAPRPAREGARAHGRERLGLARGKALAPVHDFVGVGAGDADDGTLAHRQVSPADGINRTLRLCAQPRSGKSQVTGFWQKSIIYRLTGISLNPLGVP